MRLRTLRLHGFRRFERAKLTIDGPVLAIIGPNEAGKTSILEALRRLNADDPIEATSLTFGVPPKADVIDARFWLEDADRAVLGPAGSKARWLIVTKTRKGPRRYELEPPVPRPLGPRHTAQARVAEVIASPTFAKWPGQVQQPLRLLASGLQSEEEDIPSETEARVSSVITEIGNFVRRPANAKHGALGDLRQINKVLTGLREHEAGSWNEREGTKLAGQVPSFEMFDENRRALASSYDLSKGEGAQPPQINEALKNLLRLGGISSKELRDAINTGAQGPVDTLTEKARKNLETALRSWTQRDGERGSGRSIAEGLTVKLSVRQKTILNITVSSGGTDFIDAGDRSDGVRTFMALRAFLAVRGGDVPPVLLIDEAETHLHYDAQADLIGVLEDETEAGGVIYTTHSIGCLPRDLGRGVRAIVRESESRSRVENAWTQHGAGVRPLVEAMGATTLPLTPSRPVVITEGPSDPIILPALLREATGRPLPFQVVDRLASASLDELKALRGEIRQVAFVLDGDDSGRKRTKELRELKYTARQIVALRTGRTVEDLVDPDLYVRAVNRHLEDWAPAVVERFSTADLGPLGRVAALTRWCRARGLAEISHAAIAVEILTLYQEDEPDQRRLVARNRAVELKGLFAKIERAFE